MNKTTPLADAVRAALTEAKTRPNPLHALALDFDAERQTITIKLSTGYEIRVAPGLVPSLANATGDELAMLTLTPAGMGLHLKGHVVVSLASLIEGALGTRTWMASLMR